MPKKYKVVVGLFLVTIATLFAAWGFYLEHLSDDRRRILLWVLPLASGIGAATFAGGIAARFEGLVPGMLITATGGFAVWSLSFFFLFPDSSPPKPGTSFEITFPHELSFDRAMRNVSRHVNATIVLLPTCQEVAKSATVPPGPHKGDSVVSLLARIIERVPSDGIGPVRRISDARYEIDCS
jgi:hypothetical protein